jgi:hypothetical protein
MNIVDLDIAVLSEKPVAFHPCLARLGGSATAGLFLSQLLYWTGKGADKEGWIFKSQAEWTAETCLSRYEQEQARATWKTLGVLEEKREGLPCRLYYRIAIDRLRELLQQMILADASDAEQTSMRGSANKYADFSKLDCENPHTYNTETTTEITTERGNSIANAIEAASAATPPRMKTKRSDPRTSHPAIQAAKQATGRYPPKELYDQVISTLGDKPDQQRLDRCRRAWLARGYNPNAWTWLLEWYPQGIPRDGHQMAQSQDSPPAPQPVPKPPRREIPWYSTLTGEYFDGKILHKVGPDFDWSKFSKEPAKT